MANIWPVTIGRSYQSALDQVERAIRDCPPELWESAVWDVKKEHRNVWPVKRAGASKPPAEAAQEKLLPLFAAFWNVAYHALFHVDFYLSAGKLPFDPPEPFKEDEHRANVVPRRTYTQAELQKYLRYCRSKARTTFASLTEEEAEQRLARTGQPFAELLVYSLLHAWEHAAQLNLLLSRAGIEPRGGDAAESWRQHLRHGVRRRSDAEIDAFAKASGGYERILSRAFRGFCASIEPREECAIAFEVGASFVVRVRDGRVVREEGAASDVQATVTMSRQDFLRAVVQDLELAAARADGRISVSGQASAAAKLFGMLPSGR